MYGPCLQALYVLFYNLPVMLYSCIGYWSHSICSPGNWPYLAYGEDHPNLKLTSLYSGR
ncbi:hypothetical protein BDW72DRAFT_47582 [Aspergillus terricola var. indicus]